MIFSSYLLNPYYMPSSFLCINSFNSYGNLLWQCIRTKKHKTLQLTNTRKEVVSRNWKSRERAASGLVNKASGSTLSQVPEFSALASRVGFLAPIFLGRMAISKKPTSLFISSKGERCPHKQGKKWKNCLLLLIVNSEMRPWFLSF